MRLAFNSDNDLFVLNLTDSRTGLAVTNASITAVLYDDAGALVTGGSISLSYVSGAVTVNGTTYGAATGTYRGQLPYTVAAGLTVGKLYRVDLTIDVGGNQLMLSKKIGCYVETGT